MDIIDIDYNVISDFSLKKKKYESPNYQARIKKEVSEKPKLKFLFLWVLFSALAITLIKTTIRPKHLSGALEFLQSTLPNFFAGSMFCALAFVYYSALNKTENSLLKKLVFAFVFSFLGLTLWEYIQYFMGYPIDYFDILMTTLGNILTILLILLLRIK